MADASSLGEQPVEVDADAAARHARAMSILKVLLTGAWAWPRPRGRPGSCQHPFDSPRRAPRALSCPGNPPPVRKLRNDSVPVEVAPRVFLGSVGVRGDFRGVSSGREAS